MFNLTKQEKLVVIFLAVTILVGLGNSFVKKNPSNANPGRQFHSVNKEISLPPREELININTAAFNELITLKGIGPKTAERIIEYRTSEGAFFSVEDIKNVKGIGPVKFNTIKARITTN